MALSPRDRNKIQLEICQEKRIYKSIGLDMVLGAGHSARWREYMVSYKKKFVSWLIAIALMMNPFLAFAGHIEEQLERKTPVEPGVVVVDLVVVRPLGIVATIAGAAVFIVALPFSALGGNTEETWESLVVSPSEFTFKRPMGRFEE